MSVDPRVNTLWNYMRPYFIITRQNSDAPVSEDDFKKDKSPRCDRVCEVQNQDVFFIAGGMDICAEESGLLVQKMK